MTTERYQLKNKIRIVTAASLFDGHDAAINIMRRILQSSGAEVIHLGHDRSVEERNDKIIELALAGQVSSDRRSSLDDQGTILMSAHPIYLGDGIPGAVIVEQSTNPILRQQQEILEKVISITLLVLITVASALLIFASRLTLRIRRLRNATETAIDRDGRILNQKLLAEAKSGDHIVIMSNGGFGGIHGQLLQALNDK